DRALVVHEAVETRPLGTRLLNRIADDNQGAGKDLQMVPRPSEPVHAALHISVEALAAGEIARRGEDDLRRFRGKLTTGLGGTRLHDHRPALDRPCHVERPTYGEVRA